MEAGGWFLGEMFSLEPQGTELFELSAPCKIGVKHPLQRSHELGVTTTQST